MPFAGGTYGWERLKKTSCTLCPPGGALPSGSPRRHGEAPYEVPRDEGVDTRSGSPTSQPDRAPPRDGRRRLWRAFGAGARVRSIRIGVPHALFRREKSN